MNLDSLKGIEPKTIKILNKLGIYNKEDLLTYYPYRFEIIEKTNIALLNQDDRVVIDGIVENIPTIFFYNKKLNKMTFRLNTGNNIYPVYIFNRAFLKKNMYIGTQVSVIGKYDKKHGTIIATDIKLSLLPNKLIIEPIYHVCSGISSKELNKIIINNLDNNIDIEEYIPEYLIDRYKLINKKDSILQIHNPSNKQMLSKALNYLKYEELFL